MSNPRKLALGLVLLLVVLWVMDGQLTDKVAQPPPKGTSAGALTMEQASGLPSAAERVDGIASGQDLVREDASTLATKLMVLNWLEERPPRGKIFFANNTVAVQSHLYQGLTDLPSLEWTHVLVSIANHAPYVVRRETLVQAGGNLVVKMPDPTFQAQVNAPGHSVVGVQLVVDYPWVDPAAWPAALREAFPIPSAVRLEIDAQSQSTYFVGAPDTATTVRSKGQLLIETAEGLKKSVAYPADSLDEVIVLTSYPRLTLSIDPGQLNPLPQGYDIGIRFRGDGGSDHQSSQKVAAQPAATWTLPYDPTFTKATVTVRDQKSGNQLGGAQIELSGEDQHAIIVLDQTQLVLTVLDPMGRGVPNALVVQSGATIGITDAAGTTTLPLSHQAGAVWILSREHDVLKMTVPELVANPVAHLDLATGIVLQFASAEQAAAFAAAGDIDVQGLTFSMVYQEADHQATQVYGLTVSYGESSEGWASYVFNGTPDPQDLTTVRVAGVFQVTQETKVQLVIKDSYHLEAFRESLVIYPHQQSTVYLAENDLFQSIEVRLVDTDGQAIAGAEVSTGPWAGLLTEVTDGDGRATLLVTKKADLVILAQKPGFVEASVAWPVGKQSHEISLHAARKLTVQILDASGSRSDQKIYLTDGTIRWRGVQRSQGVYEFEAVPKGELRAKLADDESTQEWVVPADTASFTLPLGG